MKAPEIAWAAGLFEGEGTWHCHRGGAQAYMGMTDRDVVDRFHEIVGMGSVRIRRRATPDAPRKDMWDWRVTNVRDVLGLIELFRPYLGQRRLAKAAEIMEATKDWGQGTSKYKTHCKRGHEFTDETTGRTTRGTRFCRVCQRAAARESARRRRAQQ